MKEKGYQLTVKFNDKAITQLEQLTKKFSLTKIGVIRQALKLFKLISDQEEKGFNIILKNEKTNEEKQIIII